jgi:hypothetical protein
MQSYNPRAGYAASVVPRNLTCCCATSVRVFFPEPGVLVPPLLCNLRQSVGIPRQGGVVLPEPVLSQLSGSATVPQPRGCVSVAEGLYYFI